MKLSRDNKTRISLIALAFLLFLFNVLVRSSYPEKDGIAPRPAGPLTEWIGDVTGYFFPRRVATSSSCINNLRQIDGAKQQWAMENKKNGNDTPTWKQVGYYIGRSPMGVTHILDLPQCPQGGTYILNRVDEAPRCTHPGHLLP